MGRKSKIKKEKEAALTEKYFEFLSNMLPLIKKGKPLYYFSDGGAKLSALLAAAEYISPLFPHLEFSLLEENCLVIEERKEEEAQAPFVFA